MPQAITTLINQPQYTQIDSITAAYVCAAGDVYGKDIFYGTVSNNDGRQFAYGNDGEKLVFMDLEDPENTVYDSDYMNSLQCVWLDVRAHS